MHNEKVVFAATQFADLALKYGPQWKTLNRLPDEEVTLIVDLLVVAGFKVQKVIPGRLHGRQRDEDSTITWLLSKVSLFKAIGNKGEDDYFATGWFDAMLCLLLYQTKEGPDQRSRYINMLVTEIERSIPLEPIQITSIGDILLEVPPHMDNNYGHGHEYILDHTRDETVLNSPPSSIGVHKECGYRLVRRRTSCTHDVLLCDGGGCGLRIPFPNTLRTYKELREFFANELG